MPVKDLLKLVIRPARIEDARACHPLNVQLGYQSTESEFVDRFVPLLAHPEHQIFVAEEKLGVILGWMHLEKRHFLEMPHCALLSALVVQEKLRSMGIGKQFLLFAEAWAKSEGLSEIMLFSNVIREEAHAFYLKSGYSHQKTAKAFMKKLLGHAHRNRPGTRDRLPRKDEAAN